MPRKGWMSPDGAYWETDDVPPPDIAAKYPQGTVERPLKPGPNYEWNQTRWAKLPDPDPNPPKEIEFNQMVIGALTEGWISETEAENWAKRISLPAIVEAVIQQQPPAKQVVARISALTKTRIRRNDPLIALAAQLKMPEATASERKAEGDRLFRQWSQIGVTETDNE